MNMHKHLGFGAVMVSTLAFAMGLVACGDDSSTSSESNESVKLETDLADGNKVVCDDDMEGVVAVTADAGYRKCEDGRWVEISEDEALSADKIIGAVEDKSSSSEKGNSSSSEKAGSSSSVIPSGSEGSSSSKGKSSSSAAKVSSSSKDKSSSSAQKVSSSSKGKSSSSTAKVSSSSKDESSSSAEKISSSSEEESSSSVMSSSEEKDPSTLYKCDADGLLYENPENCPSHSDGIPFNDKPIWQYLNPDIEYGELIDTRDGQVYKTIQIGSQIWMAENLNYDPGKVSDMSETAWSGCYDNKADSCAKYGRLYTWEVAMNNAACAPGKECKPSGNVQGVCPQGWHLPTNEEWQQLLEPLATKVENQDDEYWLFVGWEYHGAGIKLKTVEGWVDSDIYPNTNASGFSVLPSGTRIVGDAFLLGSEMTNIWSASGLINAAYNLSLTKNSDIATLSAFAKELGQSVRCLKDSPNQGGDATNSSSSESSSSSSSDKPAWQYLNPDIEYGELIDSRDGQVYKTITIGEGDKAQTWMAENSNYNVEGMSWCGGGETGTKNEGDCSLYGRLYVWHAALQACPEGWYLPSKAAWEALYTAVGGDNKNLKANADLWLENTGSNSSGFSAIPAGQRIPSEGFYNYRGQYAHFWSITSDEDDRYPWSLFFGDTDNMIRANYAFGISVRCIKGSPYQGTDGKPAWQYLNPNKTYGEIYDARDGQVYKTIQIGTQTWMAENLNYNPGSVRGMGETAWSGCYEHEADSCAKYGRLYTWEVAMLNASCAPGKECKPSGNVRGVCPLGWHLPSNEEWQQLLKPLTTKVEYGTFPDIFGIGYETDYEFYYDAGTKLKTVEGWVNSDIYPNTDDSGFSALPAGGRPFDDYFTLVGEIVNFWSTSGLINEAYLLDLGTSSGVASLDVLGKETANSVRCLKD